MSDKLTQVFEKHSDQVLLAKYERDLIDPIMSEPLMSLDQFRAALEEIVPSEEEIRNKAVDCAFDESQFQYGAKWMRLKILGEKKQ